MVPDFPPSSCVECRGNGWTSSSLLETIRQLGGRKSVLKMVEQADSHRLGGSGTLPGDVTVFGVGLPA